MSQVAWIIPAFPFVAFVLIAFGARRSPRLSGRLTIAGVLAAFVASILVLRETAAGNAVDQTLPWLRIGSEMTLPLGFQVDPLTAIMLIVVTSVSLLVQIYSTAYMHGEPGYARYYAVMALFTTAMLGVVLANNLLTIYMFWELVGLCSYLLVGHWHERPEAATAAKKAFLVTRVGDFGFLLGILLLFNATGTLKFTDIASMAASGRLAEAPLTVGILLVFCGAVGKSAQFPLHVWLPDAMEGPTPVSALIHAATMVAAGVYLMARTFPILEHSTTALAVVAAVGGFTAFFAATMGLVSSDIKRVLAYSTVSQLGYMMLAIGAGAMGAGMVHLFNHAFFKALLFLGAGSVIHLVHTNNMFEMGGLRHWRPLTFLAMTVAGASLAGIFPLSGFWSKDEVLLAVLNADWMNGTLRAALLVLALVTVLMTAFYIFRLIFLTFSGANRGHVDAHVPESSAMTAPLLILLVPSIASGLLGAPMIGNPLGTFFDSSFPQMHSPHMEFQPALALLSVALAIAGIIIAWAMYGRGKLTAGAAMTSLLHRRFLRALGRAWRGAQSRPRSGLL
ncbi:MAG: NADH-quinone oxidoreductase subunit [Chloroflexi bacterium]|nr:NADH-quinone oxidoreductase subunit [Chloroflexota bacterium]